MLGCSELMTETREQLAPPIINNERAKMISFEKNLRNLCLIVRVSSCIIELFLE